MGYRGTVHIIQEIVNRLYDTLYNFLPLDTAYSQSPNGNHRGIPWQPEAKSILDEALEQLPFLARISASRELQMKVEAAARQRGMTDVSADLASEILMKA
jgi:chlorophyllide a reductase subunit Z